MNMKKSIKYYNGLINEINDTISTLLEQTDDEMKSDIRDIRLSIADLRRKIKSKQTSELGFSKIRIKFHKEYELKLPKYGVDSFDRKLKDEMYFDVIGGGSNFIDIKTNSFPESFRIRLTYETLETFVNQNGKANLIYISGSEKLIGDKESIDYTIMRKS